MTNNDGLFIFPYTLHDWTVIVVAGLGTLVRLYLTNKNKDNKQTITFLDYLVNLLISAIMMVGLYEMVLSYKWDIGKLYIPFAFIIVATKDMFDWIFLSKDGKIFMISTFKHLVEITLNKLGLQKIDKNENNTNNDGATAN